MSEFLIAAGWGLAIVVAFFGWGWAAGVRGLAVRTIKAADLLEAPGWGMAAAVVVGGILNLAGVSTGGVACGFVVVGILLAIWPAWQMVARWRAGRRGAISDRVVVTLWAAVIVLMAVRFSGSVIVPSFIQAPFWRGTQFNPHDDMHSYLVSVERLKQTGTLGQDPFNSRQMTNALGGEHFLNELIVSAIPRDHLHMMEAGIGLVLLCMVLAALGLRMGTGGRGAAVMALVPLVVRWPTVNLSSLETSAVGLVLLVSAMQQLITCRTKGDAAGRAVWLAGLALGTVCSLKSTMIPVACLACGGGVVLAALFSRRGRLVIDGLIVGLVAIAVMLPWMMWQYGSSGSMLYPILGAGDHFEAYFVVNSPSLPWELKREAALGMLVPGALLVLMAAIFLLRRIRESAGKAAGAVLFAFLMAWVAEWVVMVQATDMKDVGRYIAPAQVAGLGVVLVVLWRIGREMAAKFDMARAGAVGAIGFGALVLWTYPEWSAFYVSEFPESLKASVSGKLQDWSEDVWRVGQMQGSLPEGEPVLVYLDTPMLMDFRRNKVFVMDWPGESSPPPGMPVPRSIIPGENDRFRLYLYQGSMVRVAVDDPEAVAEYLLGQKIHYVAYSYGDQANFQWERYLHYLSPAYGRTISRQAGESFAFQDAMMALCRTRRSVYLFKDETAEYQHRESRGLVVLDLATAADGRAIETEP